MNLHVSNNYNIACCANFCNKKIEKLTKTEGAYKNKSPGGAGGEIKVHLYKRFWE